MAESSWRTRSAMRFSVKRSVSPDTATSTTWLRDSTSCMIGFSVSAGKVSIASTWLLISSRTVRVFAPVSTSTNTEAIPSAAVEVICLMPSTP